MIVMVVVVVVTVLCPKDSASIAWRLRLVVCTASERGINIMETPPAPALPVRTAVTNQSAYMPPANVFCESPQ